MRNLQEITCKKLHAPCTTTAPRCIVVVDNLWITAPSAPPPFRGGAVVHPQSRCK